MNPFAMQVMRAEMRTGILVSDPYSTIKLTGLDDGLSPMEAMEFLTEVVGIGRGSYDCPRCGAGLDSPCRTRRGHSRHDHRARLRPKDWS